MGMYDLFQLLCRHYPGLSPSYFALLKKYKCRYSLYLVSLGGLVQLFARLLLLNHRD